MPEQFFLSVEGPALLIHGGAGSFDPASPASAKRKAFLERLVERLWARLRDGQPAIEVVYEAVFALESCGLFNAGLGACLQRDGLARLSAALMDGERQRFSGVQLVTHLLHPSQLARALQDRAESVLGPFGAQLLARELGIEPQLPLTPERARLWLRQLEADVLADAGGTVGAVARDRDGRLAAATSTGGGRGNGPERMSDSATVAGTYASRQAAISCTGIGEQIVDEGLAVRIETLLGEGRALESLCARLLQSALVRQRRYGWIVLDCNGALGCYACEQLYWAGRWAD
ncbi:isoaspartyl peptidase/L-asparaginase [Marinobacterium aestuariivivens]|uniref:Isoaspartyl peptidase/L-asparaginase n=1 Tax=Marinobacterium aestuariivivens TaxID=1698799 RepID=A0ABW2A4S5_9GAMM